MSANAIRALRQSYRALEQSVDPRLAELPSFRGELNKARVATINPTLATLTPEATTVDWATLKAHLPHQSKALESLERFYEARRTTVLAAPASVTPKVHAAFLDKLRELVRSSPPSPVTHPL